MYHREMLVYFFFSYFNRIFYHYENNWGTYFLISEPSVSIICSPVFPLRELVTLVEPLNKIFQMMYKPEKFLLNICDKLWLT